MCTYQILRSLTLLFSFQNSLQPSLPSPFRQEPKTNFSWEFYLDLEIMTLNFPTLAETICYLFTKIELLYLSDTQFINIFHSPLNLREAIQTHFWPMACGLWLQWYARAGTTESQLCSQCHHFGSLKLAMMGILTTCSKHYKLEL